MRPAQVLGDWCLSLSIPDPERLARRRRLAAAAAHFLRQDGNCGVGTGALSLALSPGLRELSLDPGSGTELTISRQLAPEWPKLEDIWEETRGDVRRVDAAAWASLSKLLWQWSSPKLWLNLAEIPEEVAAAMRAVAARMLHDLVNA